MKKKKPKKKECPECKAQDVVFTGLGQRDDVNAGERLSESTKWKFQCKDCQSFFWANTIEN